MRRRHLVATISVAGLLAAGLAACGSTESNGGTGTGGSSGKSGGTLVFGASDDPAIIDGAFVSDGESIRVIRQIFEGLVTTKQGGTDIVPSLADSWTTSSDGKTWTFSLHKGVKFQDGTPFNAAAVCANFDRWYNFTGLAQSPNVSYYWQTVFGGFKKDEDPSLGASLYQSCSAKDDSTAVITLTKASSTFLSGLSLPAFSMASPTALQKYDANKVEGSGDSPRFAGTFGTEHPIGTGPFTFQSWQRGDKLTIVRNDSYWGPKAKLDRIIFKPIGDGPARRQALESGDIDGYDLVDPSDIDALKSAGFQLLHRPAFNVGYVGFNQSKPPLDNLKIRQAIAYALNREALVKAKYPEGSVVAKEFMPPEVFGYADDVTEYPYNPDKAKQLIAESGVSNPTLTFWYPTNVSRPYMPDPSANFQAFKADLEKVGFKVVPKSKPWNPDYLNAVDGGQAQMYLLGWTGDFGDPDNFIGTFFQSKRPEWGFTNQPLFNALDAAQAETDQATRVSDYKAINKQIMDFLPGIPYVHTQPSLAFKKSVKGFVPSPVQNEDFSKVSLG